jgi:hypothetical protein
MLEGDIEDGELEIGQIADLIHDVKSVVEIVVNIITFNSLTNHSLDVVCGLTNLLALWYNF